MSEKALVNPAAPGKPVTPANSTTAPLATAPAPAMPNAAATPAAPDKPVAAPVTPGPVTPPAAPGKPATPAGNAAKPAAAPATPGPVTPPAAPGKPATPAGSATPPSAPKTVPAAGQQLPGNPHAVGAAPLSGSSLPFLPPADRGQSLPRHGLQKIHSFFQPQGLAFRLLLTCVLLPTLVVFLYLALFASDIYLAKTQFAIRSQNQQQSLDMLSTFFRSGSSSLSDSYILQNYIESPDLIAKVDAKLHIREHYTDKAHDIWYRLTDNPTQDELLRYWSWAVIPAFDPDTGIMSVEVKAFTPQMAQAICQAILDASEELVNAMNARARTDAISLAQMEVTRAEERIRAANEAMRRYRERTVILDPQAVASGLYGLVNQLEGEITKTTAELAEATTYMQTGSPRVVMLRNRLEVLQKQLQAEKARLASQMQGDRPLSALVSEFQSLTLEEEFARKQLTSAMASLETARVQAESKTLYVESFQKPLVPDESLYPRPVIFSLVFMLAAAVLLGLVSLIVAAIREHAGF